MIMDNEIKEKLLAMEKRIQEAGLKDFSFNIEKLEAEEKDFENLSAAEQLADLEKTCDKLDEYAKTSMEKDPAAGQVLAEMAKTMRESIRKFYATKEQEAAASA